MKKQLMLLTLLLIILTACGRDGNEIDNGIYVIEEPPMEESSIATEEFPRMDFDTIDFTSLIFPTGMPHGYIGHWYVQHISRYLPSRVAFTYRELDAALWLMQMLNAKGFCESQVYLQTFSLDDVASWENYFGWGLPGPYEVQQLGWTEGHEVRGYSQNVIVTIPGQSTKTIIIGAHYDSLRYPGTSDNASGTALLMENAQRMLDQDNYYTLVYVFFGAHEVGMLGGFYFYNSLSPAEREAIVIYMQADILIEGPDLIFSTGYGTGHGHELNQNTLSEQMSATIMSLADAYEIEIRQSGAMGSEKRLFLYYGHTTLSFWGLDPVRSTNFLHSYKDCYEYISAMFPGMIEKTMNAYALLLEAVLLGK